MPDFSNLVLEWLKNNSLVKKRPDMVFYPSELGSKCIRKLFYNQFLSKPIDDTSLMVFESGNVIHKWVGDFLRWCSDKKIINLVELEKPFTYVVRAYDLDVEIHGRIDSIIECEGKKYVWESKSVKSFFKRDGDGFIEYPLPLDAHIIQVHPYMRAMRLKNALIFYVDKTNFKVKWYNIIYSKTVMGEIENKIRSVISCALSLNLPQRILNYPNSWECDYCPYKTECMNDYIPDINLVNEW